MKEDSNRTFNLKEISSKFAKHVAEASDNALFGYVSSVVKLLEAQGKDITQYAIINISNPMEYKENGFRINSQWRVVPIADLHNLPVYED